ncbi:hypothetical protein KAFR_0A02270 [Kazachstania africana CBS 2517]|uniref:CWH43-like N-terminal domain-containing protein n=1 Tax=Kazachstania africana (strain ATCC 22294 / BCRC 22015 / CBS 2517 / CECT 1963 / NBRC 1671 / NRRL Y-8276) TaxID=1071382 RepID=H2AMR5_KAZAF|nr:hypothetical protein KAFR_0A02270 [Kazachstania africana CBS 2517]CCF55665.1 hypothetical protein KAFR_0A02270 [Kazachstania africana CBS 2517]
MLITMLICWAATGHPIYGFMKHFQNPVYISDIGAMRLHPLFIACSAWQGLGYAISVLCEYLQRGGTIRYIWTNSKFYMPPWYTIHEMKLIIAACILGGIGELCLLFCSIFSCSRFPKVHYTMVSIFVVLMFFSICCLSAEYFIMGKHYAVLHPLNSKDNENVKYEDLSWKQWTGHVWNKYTISAVCKIVWLVGAVVSAIGFAASSNNSTSAVFEWILAFWFGFLFIIISIDFYIGGRFKESRYFKDVKSFAGYYKYEEMATKTHLVNVDENIHEIENDSHHQKEYSTETESTHDDSIV